MGAAGDEHGGHGHARRWAEVPIAGLMARGHCVRDWARRDAESVRVRVLNMLLCDFTATASVRAFSGNGTCDMALAVPPVRVVTVTDAGGGVVHVTVREVTMLRGVELEILGRGTATLGEPGQQECDAGIWHVTATDRQGLAGSRRVETEEAGPSRAEPSGAEQSRAAPLSDERGRVGPSEAERSRADPSGGVQHCNVTTTDTATSGVLDFDCIAATHQILPWPWGSQYRNIVPREGHAWVLAALAADPQVAAAARVAEETVRSSGLSGTLLALLAYSDGSVIADGVEGSAAAAAVVRSAKRVPAQLPGSRLGPV